MNLADTLVYWSNCAKNNMEYKWGKDDLRHIRQLIEMVNHGQEKTKHEVGREGESIVRRFLWNEGRKVFQIDWMASDPLETIEVKHQEIYLPGSLYKGGPYCPHYCHGLPLKQVQDRMEFYDKTGIPPWLYVVEKSNYGKKEDYHLIYRASLVDLENLPEDRKFISPEVGRRIYDVKGFEPIYFLAQ